MAYTPFTSFCFFTVKGGLGGWGRGVYIFIHHHRHGIGGFFCHLEVTSVNPALSPLCINPNLTFSLLSNQRATLVNRMPASALASPRSLPARCTNPHPPTDHGAPIATFDFLTARLYRNGTSGTRREVQKRLHCRAGPRVIGRRREENSGRSIG